MRPAVSFWHDVRNWLLLRPLLGAKQTSTSVEDEVRF